MFLRGGENSIKSSVWTSYSLKYQLNIYLWAKDENEGIINNQRKFKAIRIDEVVGE
jgi:hypothetical protein